MAWQVTQVTAAQLQQALADVPEGMDVVEILLVAPMLRDAKGTILADAIFAIVAKAWRGLAAPAESKEVSEVVQAPPDELAGLPVSLRGVLDANGITTRAELAATWKELFTLEAFDLAGAAAIQDFLRNGDGASSGHPQAGHHPPSVPAAPSPPPPAPKRPAFNPPPPTPSGLILLPGMENLRQVPRGYERPRAELSPDLRNAAVLDGKPNVFHQDAVVLPRKRMDGERDGVTEPGEPA